MRLAETVVLGLLQGPAELLPISSSAHAELIPWMLGWRQAQLPDHQRKEVEVALHAGTAVALAVAQRRSAARRGGFLALATAPPALAGLAWERAIEARLGTPGSIAAGLLAGSAALVLADRAPALRSAAEAGTADALCLGVAQMCALMPGVSRSGATRAAARARGFEPAGAAALSREVALPILVGATLLKGVRVARRRPAPDTLRALGAGAGAAALSTLAAIRLEREARVPLGVWAAYRSALAVAVLVVRHNRRR